MQWPDITDSFACPAEKLMHFSLKITRLLRTTINTENGHFSVSSLTNSFRLSIPLYGHRLHGHCALPIWHDYCITTFGLNWPTCFRVFARFRMFKFARTNVLTYRRTWLNILQSNLSQWRSSSRPCGAPAGREDESHWERDWPLNTRDGLVQSP